MQAQAYLAIFNIILAFFLSIVVFSLKTKGSIWLTITILLYAAHEVLRWGTFTENTFVMVYLPVVIFPASFFVGSSIYLYTNRILFEDKKPKIYLHLIVPALFFLTHLALLIIIPDRMTVTNIKNQTGFHRLYTLILGISILVFNLIIMWLAFLRIKNYKKTYKENFSNEISKNLQWLIVYILFNIGFVIIKFAVVVYCIIKSYGVPFTIADEIVLMMILFIFIFYLITKPQILPVILEDKPSSDTKYARVNLPDDIRVQYAKRLEKHMLGERPFLDDTITINQIAEVINIPRHHLSMTINIEFNQNFYSYINDYRIRYAEKLLQNPDDKDESILMVAYSAGFQSKSSFYKAFKIFKGITPTEYRKKHLQ